MATRVMASRPMDRNVRLDLVPPGTMWARKKFGKGGHRNIAIVAPFRCDLSYNLPGASGAIRGWESKFPVLWESVDNLGFHGKYRLMVVGPESTDQRLIVAPMQMCNVWEEGGVCWGGAGHPETIAAAHETFFSSPFNLDLTPSDLYQRVHGYLDRREVETNWEEQARWFLASRPLEGVRHFFEPIGAVVRRLLDDGFQSALIRGADAFVGLRPNFKGLIVRLINSGYYGYHFLASHFHTTHPAVMQNLELGLYYGWGSGQVNFDTRATIFTSEEQRDALEVKLREKYVDLSQHRALFHFWGMRNVHTWDLLTWLQQCFLPTMSTCAQFSVRDSTINDAPWDSVRYLRPTDALALNRTISRTHYELKYNGETIRAIRREVIKVLTPILAEIMPKDWKIWRSLRRTFRAQSFITRMNSFNRAIMNAVNCIAQDVAARNTNPANSREEAKRLAKEEFEKYVSEDWVDSLVFGESVDPQGDVVMPEGYDGFAYVRMTKIPMKLRKALGLMNVGSRRLIETEGTPSDDTCVVRRIYDKDTGTFPNIKKHEYSLGGGCIHCGRSRNRVIKSTKVGVAIIKKVTDLVYLLTFKTDTGHASLLTDLNGFAPIPDGVTPPQPMETELMISKDEEDVASIDEIVSASAMDEEEQVDEDPEPGIDYDENEER